MIRLHRFTVRQLPTLAGLRHECATFSSTPSSPRDDSVQDDLQYLRNQETLHFHQVAQHVQSIKDFVGRNVPQAPSALELLNSAGPRDYICVDKALNALVADSHKASMFNDLDHMLRHHKDLQEEAYPEWQPEQPAMAKSESKKSLEAELMAQESKLAQILDQLETNVEALEGMSGKLTRKEPPSDSVDLIDTMADSPSTENFGRDDHAAPQLLRMEAPKVKISPDKVSMASTPTVASPSPLDFTDSMMEISEPEVIETPTGTISWDDRDVLLAEAIERDNQR